MLLRDLTKVYISEYEEIEDHGESDKLWKYKGQAWLNMQSDVSELDRKTTGEIDYSIINARTNRNYDIKKSNGISLTDISKLEDFVPDYIVTDNPKIGNTVLYKLEKNQQ